MIRKHKCFLCSPFYVKGVSLGQRDEHSPKPLTYRGSCARRLLEVGPAFRTDNAEKRLQGYLAHKKTSTPLGIP